MKKWFSAVAGLIGLVFAATASAQFLGIGIGGAAGAGSLSAATVKMIAGGSAGGTGSSQMTTTNTSTATATIPTSVFTINSGDPVTELATGTSTNTSTAEGTVTAAPGVIGGYGGGSIGVGYAAAGQFYGFGTATQPVIPSLLPALPPLTSISVLPAL
jgi:hypothetical protein